jgi:hypothetical protein
VQHRPDHVRELRSGAWSITVVSLTKESYTNPKSVDFGPQPALDQRKWHHSQSSPSHISARSDDARILGYGSSVFPTATSPE